MTNRKQFALGIGCISIVAAFVALRDRDRKFDPRPAPAPIHGPRMAISPAELSQAGAERSDNELAMKFCFCPSGQFRLGQDDDAPDVTLSQRYWMGKYEVTQLQWEKLMGFTLRVQRARDLSQPRPVGDGTTRDHVGEGPDYPIYYVSYDDAIEFARKFTSIERAVGRLDPDWIYSLPTEAQWEYACRSGTLTRSAFGDAITSNQANFDGSKGKTPGPYLHETTPVGRYPANGWGLHDMHGNVWEWCRDAYVDKPRGGVDPCEVASTSRHVYRGGCWHNPVSLSSSSTRAWGDATDRGSGLGFRLVLVPFSPAGER